MDKKSLVTTFVDFYCPSAKLVIEVNGSQHYEEEGMRNDRRRDEYLSGLGFYVFIFPLIEMFQNLDGILKEIYHYLQEESP